MKTEKAKYLREIIETQRHLLVRKRSEGGQLVANKYVKRNLELKQRLIHLYYLCIGILDPNPFITKRVNIDAATFICHLIRITLIYY